MPERRLAIRWAKLGANHYNRAAELKLRAERKAGELLAASEFTGRGGDRKSSSQSELDSLEGLGVTKKESHRWQAIAVVPAEEFEGYVAKCRDAP